MADLIPLTDAELAELEALPAKQVHVVSDDALMDAWNALPRLLAELRQYRAATAPATEAKAKWEWRPDGCGFLDLWRDDERTGAWVGQSDDPVWTARTADKVHACDSIRDGQARICAHYGIRPEDVRGPQS